MLDIILTLPAPGTSSALTVTGLYASPCLYLVLCVVFLSDFSSFFSLVPWALSLALFLVPPLAPSAWPASLTWSLLSVSSPGPLLLSLLLPGPFLSGSFYLASSDQRWEFLRSGGRVDRQGRWESPICLWLFLPLPPSQYISGPHTHLHMNYNI